MNTRSLVVIVAVFAVVASANMVVAADNRPNGPVVEAQAIPGAPEAPPTAPPRAAGTIVYDTGVASAWYNGGGLVVGNLFNSGYSTGGLFTPILTPGTVTRVTFNALGIRTGVSTAQVQVFGATAASVAPVIGGGVKTGIVVGGLTFAPNTLVLPVPAAYSGSYFMAGVLNTHVPTTTLATPFSAMTPGLAMTTNTTVGPHGILIFPGGTFFGAFGSVDALVRATGNIVVPVELMSFNVE